jgi:hypothetical protein
MPTFIAGSTHTLKIQLKLRDDDAKDEDELPVDFWLLDSKGKRHEIIKATFIIWDGKRKRMVPRIHLTKTFQEVTFIMKMPKKTGDYQLVTNLSGLPGQNQFFISSDVNWKITIMKYEHS